MSASSPVTKWNVNWGDGQTQEIPASNPSTVVSHTFPAYPATYGVLVTATDVNGTYSADNSAAFDQSFATNGTFSVSLGSTGDHPRKLIVQPDGKIIALSSISSSSLANNSQVCVSRFNPDGTLDSTFGTGGRFIFNKTAYGEGAGDLTLQSDGKIVVCGNIASSFSDFDVGQSSLLFRLLPDGSLDPAFGTNNGWITYDFGDYEALTSVAIDASGRIIVGGQSRKLIIARCDSNGLLDTTFASGGLFSSDLGNGAYGLDEMMLQADGKILAIPVGGSFSVIRLTPDGALDPTFDGDGIAAPNVGPSGWATSMALSDGNILIAGTITTTSGSGYSNVLTKLNPDGSLDASFAQAGELFFDVGAAALQPIVRMMSDGRFYVGGTYTTTNYFRKYPITRFENDGTRDQTFAGTGRFTVDIGTDSNEGLLYDLAVQADNALLMYAGNGQLHTYAEAIVRLAPPGPSVRISDLAPVPSISGVASLNEGDTYTLSLGATDPDGDAISEWIVNWGDNSVSVVNGNAQAVTHIFTDGPKSWTIKASAIDSQMSIGSTTTPVTINNLPPAISNLSFSSNEINEGQNVTFSGLVSDPGSADSMTLTITWGDGPTSNFSIPAGATRFDFVHKYTDDKPSGTSSDLYTPIVTLKDKDGAIAPATAAPSIRVDNVAPTPAITGPGSGEEGSAMNFTGIVTDPGTDTFTYAWTVTRGGQTVTTSTVSSPSFIFTPRDNGDYVLSLVVNDDDGGSGSFSEPLHVTNVAPVLWGLAITPGEINEGETATLSGNFIDVGIDDTFTLTVDWRDGSPIQSIPLPAGTHTISVPHQYADDLPPGTSSDILTANVSLSDNDGGITDGTPVERSVSFTNPAIISNGGGKVSNLDAHFIEDRTWVEAFADGSTSFQTGSLSIASAGYLMQRNSSSLVRGFYIEATDGAAFTLSSLDYRIAATTSLPGFSSSDVKVLISTAFDPTKDASQMQQFSVGGTAQSTFTTLNLGTAFSNVSRLYISSSASVDFDNVVLHIGSAAPAVRVDNVPPQNLAIDAFLGSPSPESTVILNATANDPGGADDPLNYDWLITRDGVSEATASGTNFTFAPGSSGVYTVHLTATDDDLGVSTIVQRFIFVAPGMHYALETSSITVNRVLIGAGGTLNLGDSALVVDYDGPSPLASVMSMLQTGYNGGQWNGDGIATSAPVKNVDARFTVGVAEAADVLGISSSQTALWNGQTVDSTAILLAYTFAGDANLDGIINGDDYFWIDAGFSSKASGYANGDFDYNGRIDADDYFLIDSNYDKSGVVALVNAHPIQSAIMPGGVIAQNVDPNHRSAYQQLTDPFDLLLI